MRSTDLIPPKTNSASEVAVRAVQATREVKRLKIKYFDTVPTATSLHILKSGFLFIASETGNPHFYQFEKLGGDDDETEFTSDDFPADPLESYKAAYFHPCTAENVRLVQSIESMNPLLDCKVANLLDEDAPQIYSLRAAAHEQVS
jgi:splicing factor 3B subunit 3